jgi:colanic acid/amylovoran biosynthesis glycosyltransferase
MNKRNNIIHLVTPFLFHTGPWIYSQILKVTKFNNYIFTQERKNESQFPYDQVYSLNDLGELHKNLNKIYFKYCQQYGLFFKKYFTKIDPLCFHAHFGYEAVRWFNFVKNTNRPLITTFYGLDVSKLGQIKRWRDDYQKLFKYGSFFLAEGSFLKKQLVELGCPEEKIIIQHLGIDFDKYPHKDNYSNQNKIIILQVSTFREKKGIEYSLKSLSKIKEIFPDFVFNLIGAGDDSESEGKIINMIKELSLSKHVNLLGIKTHDEMQKEMMNSDIFLHPSVTALDGDNEGGAPVSIIEASAMGLPVISTLHADIPEVIINGETGLLVAERNVSELTDKILLLMNSVDLREKFGNNGRNHIEKYYKLKDLIINLEKIYSSFL